MARIDGEQSSGELINLGFLLSILETGEMLGEWGLLNESNWAFLNVKFQQNSG